MARAYPAVLSSGNKSVGFQVVPELTWGHIGEFSQLPVLDTNQPQVKYKYSSSTLSIPQVRLFGDGNNADIVKTITSWCKAGEVVSYTFGSLKVDGYIQRFLVTEEQWRDGLLWQAKASLDLLILPAPNPKKVEAPVRKSTPRELLKKKPTVRKTLTRKVGNG